MTIVIISAIITEPSGEFGSEAANAQKMQAQSQSNCLPQQIPNTSTGAIVRL
jgi:hypothetical protein